MNDNIRAMGRPTRSSLPAVRAAHGFIAVAALVLLVAACGSGPSSPRPAGSASGGTSAHSRSAVAYSSCIRSHGVPNYPDPSSGGILPKTSAQHLGVSSSQFSAAQQACQHLLPRFGGQLSASSLQQCYLAYDCPQALVQRAMTAGLHFARCMRAHGAPSWPDPTIDPEGRPLFNINVPRPAPPQVNRAINVCTRLEHPGSLLAWG
jgi:hypothetical protein